MKVFFLKDDSLYKIFRTLEKIPARKTLVVHIEAENPFYTNDWRGKELLNLIDRKKREISVITTSEKMRLYYDRLGLPYQHEEQHRFFKVLHLTYLFFFNIKKFHLHLYSRKNYAFYLIFGFESLVIGVIFYAVYLLIIPSAHIQITPTFTVEDVVYNFRYYPVEQTDYARDARYLTIPYYSGSMDYSFDLSIQSDNVTYTQEPAQGEMTVVNTTDQEYTLVPNTTWMTDGGLVFAAVDWSYIPPGTPEAPSYTPINVQALDVDNSNQIIGDRGNILKGTPLYIRNLSISYQEKRVYALATDNFVGGVTNRFGTVDANDHDLLSGKLLEYLNANKLEIVRDSFRDPGALLLGYQDMIRVIPEQVQIHTPLGAQELVLSGTIQVRLLYETILWEDLLNSIRNYINERAGDTRKVMNIERNSLIFYDREIDGVASIIPTKMSVIWGYDFDQDANQIQSDIISQVIGDNPDDAEELILSYPEIANVQIRITPPWYHEIPRLRSRINVDIND